MSLDTCGSDLKHLISIIWIDEKHRWQYSTCKTKDELLNVWLVPKMLMQADAANQLLYFQYYKTHLKAWVYFQKGQNSDPLL